MKNIVPVIFISIGCLTMLLSGCGSKTASDFEYYYVREGAPADAWERTYADELKTFCKRLLHDPSTFNADLSEELDSLSISMVTSPDGRLKIYSWHDGEHGTMVCHNSLYQTNINGKFHADILPDMVEFPLDIYQFESIGKPIYLVHFYMQESSSLSAQGFEAYSITKKGKMEEAKIFGYFHGEELSNDEEAEYYVQFESFYPIAYSAYYEGGWSEDLFFGLTQQDIYLPHIYKDGPDNAKMTDYYDHLTWSEETSKFTYEGITFNPKLARFIEEGELVCEFPLGKSYIRIDKTLDGTYRYLAWKQDKIFSDIPDLEITDGWYHEVEHLFHFVNEDYEYVFDAQNNRLTIYQTKNHIRKTIGNYFINPNEVFSNM